MTGFIMFLHAGVCILLGVIILMQSGRGGGLTENFAAAESMFGAQTSEFLTKSTTVLATLFFVTCLGLAILSARKDKSLMSNQVVAPVTQPQATDVVGDLEDLLNAAPLDSATENQ